MGFILFWHRAGNTPAGIHAVHAAAERSPATFGGRSLAQGVELDLKWTGDGPLLYAYHGPTGRERLAEAVVRRRAEDQRLLTVDALFRDPRAESLHYLVEIKCGHGSPVHALSALSQIVESSGLAARVWLASTSLDLLTQAQQAAPALRRVLFAHPVGERRVLHKPTTYTWRSLRRHGVTASLPAGVAQVLCPIGLRAQPLAVHDRLATAARARDLDYLPGRVTTRETLEALAKAGHAGAFVYAAPEAFG